MIKNIALTLPSLRMLSDPRLAILFYFGISLLIRFSGVHQNVLYADDYLYFVDHSSTIIDFDICRFPAQDYRWFIILNICLSGSYFENFVLTFWPKVLANLFLAGLCFSFYSIFIRWRLNKALAITLPLVILAHPIVNELTLWNITGSFVFIYLMVTVGYYFLSFSKNKSTRLLAIAALIFAVLSYEYSLIIFLVLAVSEPFICGINGGTVSVKKTMKLIVVFIFVSLIYILQAKLTPILFVDDFTHRGVDRVDNYPSNLDEIIIKFRTLLNLLTNVYMTPMSFYIRIERIWGLWKWIPLSVTVLTMLSVYLNTRSFQRSLIYASFSIIIVLLPLGPFFIATQSPESWRVSVPCLIAVVMSIIPSISIFISVLTSRLKKFLSMFFLIILMLLMNTSRSESDLRVLESKIEDELIATIKTYWEARGVVASDYRVGRIKGNYFSIKRIEHYAQNLSVSFHRRNMHLSIDKDFAWRGKLLNSGINVVEIEKSISDFTRLYGSSCLANSQCATEFFSRYSERCEKSPNVIQYETGIRIVHSLQDKISVICI